LDAEGLEDLLRREYETFGVNHREIGEAVLEYWNFPDEIIACQPFWGERPQEESAPSLAGLCEVARSCSHSLLNREAEFQGLYEQVRSYLRLGPEEMNQILLRTLEQVQHVADALNVEVKKQKDLIHIMEKANRALTLLLERVSASKRTSDLVSLPSFDTLDEENATVTHALQAVAHEIRNPLVAVGGFARKLAESLDPVSEEGKYAQIILNEARRLENALLEMTLGNSLAL
jgi:signal transduction histidine kinase